MRRLLTILLILLASTASAGLLSIHSAASGTYSAIATTTADSVPTPRYVIQASTGPQYTPLVAATASPGPRLSIGGNTYMLGSATPAIGGITSLVTDASGTWVCHTFLTSGDLIVNSEIATAEYLIVAGGGGGASNLGGGGGAGGTISTIGSSPAVLAAGKYTIVVGAGGAGEIRTPTITPAANGADSTALTLTAIGGGRGRTGGGGNGDGYSGGSGGGASAFNTTTLRTGGAATAGQGNAGGSLQFSVASTSYSAGAGGGGAGAPGVSSIGVDGLIGTNGGDGIDLSSWLGTRYGEAGWFAGGGGGGALLSGAPDSRGFGGSGGGGDAAATVSAGSSGFSGMSNTGGGGGSVSASSPSYGGNGGSGIVVVRYLIEEAP